jgi:predicted NAD/FAD-binding protein
MIFLTMLPRADVYRKKYVDAILSKVPKENLHLNTEITAVRSLPDGVELTEAGGAKHIYDHVILAWVPTGSFSLTQSSLFTSERGASSTERAEMHVMYVL